MSPWSPPLVAAIALGAILSLAGCSTPPADEVGSARDRLDDAIERAVLDGLTPGGVLYVESSEGTRRRAFGNRSLQPEPTPTRLDTIYDLASLTKVVATAPSVMILEESGAIRLDDPIASYLPEFLGPNKGAITIKHALTHTTGLPPGLSLRTPWTGLDSALQLASKAPLRAKPGTDFIYSDINFILLGALVERVSGQALDQFAQEHLFEPLGMRHTRYLPPSSWRHRIAPTERVDGSWLQGIVHDPTARRLGGVAGHAGLFSTASDVARFARMFLNEGELDGVRVLRPQSVRWMTSVQTEPGLEDRRGLGWDIDTGYTRLRGALYSKNGYGHTGFTGPSLWIDKDTRSFVLFLCNRNHPDGRGNVLNLREEIGTLAAGYVLASVAEAPRFGAGPRLVLNGIEALVAENFERLQGRKIGLITNHTGRDRNGVSTIKRFLNADGLQLNALFSPEHGIEGILDEQVADSRYADAGLPIFSLYGATKEPTAQSLEGLDTLVFDIQDIGCRYYTYISTMGMAMRAAEKHGLRFVVLDRINPINGFAVEGPQRTGTPAFVAFHDIPIRHGMTVGELARLFQAERFPDLELEIVELVGWRRDLWMDDTDREWVNPSPNMRSLTEATLYPGIGILEFADLSVGRGTETPFEHIGAPYIDSAALLQKVTQTPTPGLQIRETAFTPNASKFARERCEGLAFEITDRDAFRPVRFGLHLAAALHALYPNDFDLQTCETLLKHQSSLDSIRDGTVVEEIVANWEADEAAFVLRRKPFLLY